MKRRLPLLAIFATGIVAFAATILLSAAAPSPLNAAPAADKSILIRDIPHVKQKPDFCGEACAAMALKRLGYNYDQDAVFDQSGLTPADARGCYTREMQTALQRIGFDTGPVWHKIRADRAEAAAADPNPGRGSSFRRPIVFQYRILRRSVIVSRVDRGRPLHDIIHPLTRLERRVALRMAIAVALVCFRGAPD